MFEIIIQSKRVTVFNENCHLFENIMPCV